MASPSNSSQNGGILGVSNNTSFGKCKVTEKTSTGTLTTQVGTRIASTLVIAGGGGAPGDRGGGGGAGGYRFCSLFSVCGSSPYAVVLVVEVLE